MKTITLTLTDEEVWTMHRLRDACFAMMREKKGLEYSYFFDLTNKILKAVEAADKTKTQTE